MEDLGTKLIHLMSESEPTHFGVETIKTQEFDPKRLRDCLYLAFRGIPMAYPRNPVCCVLYI
jgi:hypothetical protein